MPRRKTVEERVSKLENRREDYINRKLKHYEAELRARYQAKIDLLRELGFKPKVEAKSLEERMSKAKDRYVFYNKRYFELRWGKDSEKAERMAEEMYERYRLGWLRSVGG